MEARYQAILDELGPDEVERRIEDLAEYQKYATIAEIKGSAPLTVAQVRAWAGLAETLSAYVDGRELKRKRAKLELMLTVAQNEAHERERAAKCREDTADGVIALYGCSYCGASYKEPHKAEGVEVTAEGKAAIAKFRAKAAAIAKAEAEAESA